jgi:hypothetical protein
MRWDRTFPWSGSTTRVSSSRLSAWDASLDALLLAFEVALRRPGTSPTIVCGNERSKEVRLGSDNGEEESEN